MFATDAHYLYAVHGQHHVQLHPAPVEGVVPIHALLLLNDGGGDGLQFLRGAAVPARRQMQVDLSCRLMSKHIYSCRMIYRCKDIYKEQ